MNITNKYHLPNQLYKAACQFSSRQPVPGRIGVTQLIGPPQVRYLTAEHWNQIEVDAMDRLWALSGSVMHKILELGAGPNALAEERLEIKVDGITVSGFPDVLEEMELGKVMAMERALAHPPRPAGVGNDDDKTIVSVMMDWKNVSVWAFVMGEEKIDWTQQQNCYAAMFREHGMNVDLAYIIASIKDWSAGKAERENNYPRHQVVAVPITLWPHDEAMEYIASRVAIHKAAMELGVVQECTAEERWSKGDMFAVYKNDNKTATRVVDSMAQANAIASSLRQSGAKARVEKRPGVSVRCKSYCDVRAFCPQWKKEQARLL